MEILMKRHKLCILNLWCYLQQDGAPLHYALLVCQNLSNAFQTDCIGRSVAIDWPTRSSDLISFIFLFMGLLRNLNENAPKPHYNE